MDSALRVINVYLSTLVIKQIEYHRAKEVSNATFYIKTDAIFSMKGSVFKTQDLISDIVKKERNAGFKKTVGTFPRVPFYIGNRIFNSHKEQTDHQRA